MLKVSNLKNKKVLSPKKYFLSRSQYQNKKALFTDPVFSEGFDPNALGIWQTNEFFSCKKILPEKDLRKVLFK